MTTSLFSYKKFWPAKFGAAPVLPMSREEMDDLGWDSCDIIIVTGDAYVDHPSFGMAMIGRLLESQGFRVGIIAQPDWHSAESFMALGRPNLFFGITAGNMDSMVNHYTADRKPRSDDAYTAGGEAGKRPNRAAVVYSQRAKEAYKGVPVVIGGIEASLRRIAQFDYWTDKVRRSVLPDSKADMLIFGNAERAIVELAHRLAANESIAEITDIRGTAFMRQGIPSGWTELDSTQIDEPDTEQLSAQMRALTHPYEDSRNNPKCEQEQANATFDAQQANSNTEPVTHKVMFYGHREKGIERETTVIRLPSYDQVIESSLLYAHASRVFHLETNPGNARAMVQKHGKRDVWLNPPAEPLNTAEFDGLFAFPYTRQPHPRYEGMRIPAYEMIRFSINIMRGCFGGCTFCSITEHEGRIIQSRSEQSVLDEIEAVRDTVPGFTGVISDLGGPTANMYRLACKDKAIEQSCRKLSCVYPGICPNLNTNHKPLTQLYRKARSLPGVKKVAIASGLRYDLAVTDPEYVKELVTHHVGGRLKIAPEHTESGPLSRMMKPGIGSYYRFKQLFDKYSQEAGKKQYLIPYFISSHPGTADEDMLNLALWLKKNNFRPDQVQAFLPTPMALATAMYHSGYNPLKNMAKVHEPISVVKKAQQRRLHKAFLRYHDAQNHDLIRRALKSMGREDLIGHGADCLVPAYTRGASRGQGLKRGAYQGKDLHHRIEAGAQSKSTKNKPAKKKRKFSSSASAASSADARKSPSRHHKNAKPTGKSSSRNRRNKPH